MIEWKGIVTMKNGKLIIDNYYVEFEEQLQEETRLNVLIAENFLDVKLDG